MFFKNLQIVPLTFLPIDLLSFDAIVEGNDVIKLDWITYTEINNDYFIVERSKNGVDFENNFNGF